MRTRDVATLPSSFPSVVFAAIAALTSLSCDGYLGVEGRVYKSLAPGQGGSSFILVDLLSQPLPANLAPLAGAEVVVEPWTPERRPVDDLLWVQRATTDDSGYFKTGSVEAPGRYDATITV